MLVELAERLLADERRDLLYQVLCSMPLCASGSSTDDAQMNAVFVAATRAADADVRALAASWLAARRRAPELPLGRRSQGPSGILCGCRRSSICSGTHTTVLALALALIGFGVVLLYKRGPGKVRRSGTNA